MNSYHAQFCRLTSLQSCVLLQLSFKHNVSANA